MSVLQVRRLEGGEMPVSEGALRDLGRDVRGTVVRQGDPAYDEARKVWNGMIDRRPALIVRCENAEDVAAAVDFAREHGLLTAVRGGGHNVAGSAVCDGGIVIDLSPMRSVRVDPDRRRAHAQGGATLGDVDRATQAFGLATPLGLVSRTGIAGLTLGGGFGWLTRRYGLTCDNLRSAEIVTADGALRTVSETQEPDLFWALRGGGGNFGVVTSFEYELYPVGPEVTLAAVFYPIGLAQEGLAFFREFMANAPEAFFGLTVMWSLPEGPEFPAEQRGDPVFVFVGVHSGDLEEGKRIIQPLRAFDRPLADVSGPVSWMDAQTFFDGDYPDRMYYYWKSAFLNELSDDAIRAVIASAANRPSSLSNVDVWYLGGAMARVPPDATAFWGRDAQVMIGVEANWTDLDEADRNIAWGRATVESLKPYTSGSSYVNFAGFGAEADNAARSVYGGNYERLARIKHRYDPDNLFRLNHNIEPVPET